MSDHEHAFTPLSLADLKIRATAVAEELEALSDASTPASSGGGSLHRAIPPALQQRFIEVRTALFERGIYDPVLIRFDTATGSQASTSEIASQLATVAQSL